MSVDYARGYNDGFRAGLEAGKGLNAPSYPKWPSWPLPDVFGNPPKSTQCKICGMFWETGKAYGYVCGRAGCPSSITASFSVPDGLSYEEIYGSVVYQQNKKKE